MLREYLLRTTTYTYISTDTRFQPNFLLSRTRWVVLDEATIVEPTRLDLT